jgi:ribosomal-protein-alanine N-acetyltransferase
MTANWNIASIKSLEHYDFKFEEIMLEDYVFKGKNEDSLCFSLLK